MAARDHDPEACHDEGCKECQIAELKRSALKAAEARPATDRQKRDALAFLKASVSRPVPKLAGLLVAALLAGCAPAGVAEHAHELRKAWDLYRAGVAPVSSAHQRLGDSIDRAITELEDAGR